ncbi:fused MFS/spermidine synthase [Acidovorax sp.]|uniref:fused MFS/spermidine synthase n=1 Tax=Acidovorax sp. TaxID=1872122 RepID=UPI002ACDC7AC|nr:fused MFS/spermidine synthase [Acidovorax sp.]MDZ7861374.1 fused MFS/spermidine synthase [Acidovorax sp.]
MSLSRNNYRLGLLAIFVLSGFAGLIYQSIWSHYLGLLLGHAAYAQALVLAIFMGGMAAGAAWISNAGHKWRNLVRGYAIIEAVIGVFGLLFHWIFINIAKASYEWLLPILGTSWSVDLARWVIAALLILPQTILLGMTFPLMSGGLIRRFPGRDGTVLGGLYFTNSIGAALGALTAVFVLLPWVGLPGAMLAAALLNFVVAGLAWWLAREPEPSIPDQKLVLNKNDAPSVRSTHENSILRVVLLSTALSGAASFIYEIVWVRMLSLAVGSTMQSFELMLASFIAGIGLGGLWVRKQADDSEAPLRVVGCMQIGMGVAALASLAVYANAFDWVGWLIGALGKTEGGYVLFNAGTAAISMLIMLPAAFFAGTTLPLFTVALLRKGHGERSIGQVYAWNTLGAILGVFAATHFLIPAVGLKLSLCIAALLDLAIGLFLLRWQADTKPRVLWFTVAAGFSAIALIAAIRIPFDPMQLASGVFRHGKSLIEAGSKIVFYEDGKTSSISVTAAPNGSVSIATNGKPDAALMMQEGRAATDDEPTMVLAAALPLAMLDAPKKAGVIGFGSGLTTHTLLGDTRLTQVDTIEIEESMVKGARAFGPRVERAYNDPRSKIIIDDAKAYFAGQKSKYDLIISEPSNPWISGVGALFSKEFYQFVPKHLNSGGLFVQWVQLYEINDALVGSILKGLTPEFEDYSAWISNSSDLLIIASPKGPLPPLNFSHLQNSDVLLSELAKLGVTATEHLTFRKVADAKTLRALSRLHDAPTASSDYHPVLGLEAPQSRFRGSVAETTMTLPFLNALLLESLSVREPLPTSIPKTEVRLFPAEISTWRARAMDADLRGNGTSSFPSVVLLKATAAACASPPSREQLAMLSSSIKEVAERSIPFLPASQVKDGWKKPQWLKCTDLPPDFNRVFSLLDARARRDYAEMKISGENWLQSKTTESYLSRDFDSIALSNIMLALAHAKNWKELLKKAFRLMAAPR